MLHSTPTTLNEKHFMKRYYRLLTLIFAFAALPCKADEWIRINQLGYLPQSIKVAVFMSETKTDVQEYALVDAFTGKTVRTFIHGTLPDRLTISYQHS